MLVTAQELSKPTLKASGITVLHSVLLDIWTFAKIQCSKLEHSVSGG